MRRFLSLLVAVAFVAFANGCGDKVENKIASTPAKLPEGKTPVKASGGPGQTGGGTGEGPKAE
jgi:hypothetical protein